MNNKGFLWRTIWMIVSLMVLIMFLSWLHKRVDLLCVLSKLSEVFKGCRR